MHWPGNIPDFNLIEHVWAKSQLKYECEKITTMAELKETIEKTWYDGIADEYLSGLYTFMPKRVKSVIKDKGGATKC